MKKLSVLSLVVISVMVFSIPACKKAAEAPKPAEQGKAPAAIVGFETMNGTLEKGGLGYILSSLEKDKLGVALKKTDTPYKNSLTIKGKMKSAQPSGTRNGYILFGESLSRFGQAGVLIGGMKYAISGHYAEKKEVPAKFDQNKVFDIELIINIKDKTVTFKVDGTEVKTKMNYRPKSVDYVGYAAANTKTEFSDLEVSGN